MSTFDISQAVQQYTSNVQLQVQQKASRLREAVMTGTHYGKQASVVDQYAAVTARKVTQRNAPLVPFDIQTDRRWAVPVDYDWNDLVDEFDKLRLVYDPKSTYVQAGAAALSRAMDDEIITAIFGTAKTGETGSTSTSFLSGNQIAHNFATTTTMTLAKLIEARRLLRANEVDTDSDPLYCALTAKQESDLLNETKVTSLDYNDKPVLVDGKLTSFMGINFIHIERLPVDGSSYRRIPVWAKSGLHLGIWGEIKASIDKRLDLSSLPWQVYVMGTFGATRTEEKKVVEIKCTES